MVCIYFRIFLRVIKILTVTVYCAVRFKWESFWWTIIYFWVSSWPIWLRRTLLRFFLFRFRLRLWFMFFLFFLFLWFFCSNSLLYWFRLPLRTSSCCNFNLLYRLYRFFWFFQRTFARVTVHRNIFLH